VYVFTGDGELLSLPVEWTDLAGEDPFVVVAAGRSLFRTQDLLDLAGLLQALSRPGRAPSQSRATRASRSTSGEIRLSRVCSSGVRQGRGAVEQFDPVLAARLRGIHGGVRGTHQGERCCVNVGGSDRAADAC
jgi:hypothetical protein